MSEYFLAHTISNLPNREDMISHMVLKYVPEDERWQTSLGRYTTDWAPWRIYCENQPAYDYFLTLMSDLEILLYDIDLACKAPQPSIY